MRTTVLAVLVALAAVIASQPAEARGRHHHHSHVHLGIGFGFGPYWGPWSPWWYPPPAYYPPAVIVRPAEPVTYIEQPQANEPSGWWYYCDASKGYYPYVKECPSGWQRVPPAPPPSR